MSDLPEPIDATQPGIFDFGHLKIFNLGDDVWIIAGRDRDGVASTVAALKVRLPKVTALGIGTDYAANYTPLEKSTDLTRMIRLIVREEMKVKVEVLNDATE